MVNLELERMQANPSAVTRHLRHFVPKFDFETLQKIASQFEWVGFYPPGYEIIRQGEPGDSMYIIDHGSVKVIRNAYGLLTLPTQTLAVLGEGQVFGEMALINNQPRNASVVAESQVAVFSLSSSNWGLLRASYPIMGAVFEKIARDRIDKDL